MARIKLKIGENEIEVDSRDFYVDNQTLGEVIDNISHHLPDNEAKIVYETEPTQKSTELEQHPTQFGLEYLDDSTAILFHKASGQTDGNNELCLNSDCAPGVLSNGRFERQVDANVGEDYLVEFRVQQSEGECSTSSIVAFDTGSNGRADSPCAK